MNLAPIRYAKILTSQGGPVEKVATGKIRIGGEEYYQAAASLSTKLNLHPDDLEIFSRCDGGGTDRSAMVARHKAISEALERWAFQQLTRTEHSTAYGFELESSTTGMAAYPGMFSFQSRKRAYLEAEERFCIENWWKGRLTAQQTDRSDRSSLRIENPISSHAVILTWKRCPGDFVAYGTAAGRTATTAEHKALIEMERSARALTKYHQEHPGVSVETVTGISNYSERQILYYSLPEGHARFQERLKQAGNAWQGTAPKPIVDCHIPGPWQQYATVWRVLFPVDSPSPDNSPASNFLY